MIMKNLLCVFMCAVITILVFNSCKKDVFYDGNDVTLRFSVDTLRFDTVFTELGSATRTIKVFNDLDEAIKIEEISIANGSNSFFTLNVDGTPGTTVNDIQVAANDSVYIFAEVTIDPDNPLSISPFFVEDQINLTTNGSNQIIYLEAWGQNANYIPNRFGDSDFFFLCQGLQQQVWDDPKPYVIYGALIIDSCELFLPPGTQIYVHGGVGINENISSTVYNDGIILVGEGGKITSMGSIDEPVIIQGDRLEMDFDDISGQWNGISFLAGSRGNVMNHTIVRHSIVGVRVDSMANISLNSCEFAHTASSGLLGVHAEISAENCLFYDNGGFGIQLSYGGDYDFKYCSSANYDNQSAAVRLDNFFDVSLFDEIPPVFNPINARFTNCIFVGNDTDEISLADGFAGTQPAAFQYQFDHCIVNVDELLDPAAFPNFFDNCNNCIQEMNGDTLFIDRDLYDFHLDTASIAIDVGVSIMPFVDKDGVLRNGAVDIGCYEFQF